MGSGMGSGPRNFVRFRFGLWAICRGSCSRSCLGMRFAVYEMKVILSVLLNAFEFRPSPDCKISWLDHTILAPHVEGDPSLVNRLPLVVSEAH
ncbi:hypothetical protein SCHPADRAFT_189186 [Schizopora paradoxa]|uniref:Cytochrome P450 n=1 Tax=Schizopora paradoxa TaxID=27342 RepID=A0A0H2RXQ8_9AGAM|nr:hypothetical protein SCHPADRAFT_189186 [Schizopora paradoxa]